MDYPKLISEKFNCLQAIYFYAPSALAVPMCDISLPQILVWKFECLAGLAACMAAPGVSRPMESCLYASRAFAAKQTGFHRSNSKPGGELSFPKQVYLWGLVKSMDANVQIRSEMCVYIAQLMNIHYSWHRVYNLYGLFRQYTTDCNALFVIVACDWW